MTTGDGKQFDTTRAYIYRFKDDTIHAYFHETPERLFHTLDRISDQSATADHTCEKDRYAGIYTFIRPEEFHLEYRVFGPNKNYEMKTVYTKESS